MKIRIKTTPEEISALVIEMRERINGTEIPIETMLKSIQKAQKVAQKATDDIAEEKRTAL